MKRSWLAGAVALAGCQGVSPLTNKIAVGDEPLVVMVATGVDNQVDLFAASPGGGAVHRLTFTRNPEFSPAIHPGGAAVAFLRRGTTMTDSSSWLAVMNLVNAAEREAAVPAGIGKPQRVGWSADGTRLYVSGEYGFAASPAPPAAMALAVLEPGSPEVAAADSATAILLGTPPIARVEACSGSCIATMAQAMCVVSVSGERQELGTLVRWPARWGPDSLGYIEGDQLMVRSLAGGKARVVALTKMPKDPGMVTYWAPEQ
jgi:hypothetical protein